MAPQEASGSARPQTSMGRFMPHVRLEQSFAGRQSVGSRSLRKHRGPPPGRDAIDTPRPPFNQPRRQTRSEGLSSLALRVPRAGDGGHAGSGRSPRRAPDRSAFKPRLDRPMMRQLLQETNMTRTELYRLFNRFKALCQLSGTPGSINKQMFKDGVSSLAFEDVRACM